MSEKIEIYRINDVPCKLIKIDSRDEKILSLLSEDSRIPLTKISKKIKLSKEGTFYRINRLKKKNVVLKFYPIFDLRNFGYYTYHVFMVINEQDPERRKQLLNHLIEHPNTKGVMEYSDRWDLEWILITKDVQEFDNILISVTKKFYDIIIEKHKFEIIFGYKSIQFPDPYNQGEIILRAKKVLKKDLDETDIKIIRILSEDAKLSTYKISEKIKTSPDTVSYRIKKLHKEGVMRHFSIMPNLSKLGYHMHTMCIDIKTFDLNHEMKFKEYISQRPEIIRAVKVLGDWDLMLNIVVKKTENLHQIVKDIQKNFVDIIINYQIWGAYKEHFFTCLPKIIK